MGKRARRVALGEIDNPAYLPIIFEPPANADWRDEALWRAVNPGLAEGFPVLEEMRQAATEAADKPGELDDFKQFNLNFWSDAAVSPFIDMAIYDAGAAAVDLDDLKPKLAQAADLLAAGHRDQARTLVQEALKQNPKSPCADEARKFLAQIK